MDLACELVTAPSGSVQAACWMNLRFGRENVRTYSERCAIAGVACVPSGSWKRAASGTVGPAGNDTNSPLRLMPMMRLPSLTGEV